MCVLVILRLRRPFFFFFGASCFSFLAGACDAELALRSSVREIQTGDVVVVRTSGDGGGVVITQRQR
jgi:hypothetical protein